LLMTARVHVLELLLNLECITHAIGIAAVLGRNSCNEGHIPQLKPDSFLAASTRMLALSFSLNSESLGCGSRTHERNTTA
jgi:hypothetical protein